MGRKSGLSQVLLVEKKDKPSAHAVTKWSWAGPAMMRGGRATFPAASALVG